MSRADVESDEDDLAVNPSTAPAIGDIVAARMSRRTALKGLAGAGFFGLFGACTIFAISSSVPARLC